LGLQTTQQDFSLCRLLLAKLYAANSLGKLKQFPLREMKRLAFDIPRTQIPRPHIRFGLKAAR
jgi:hypothetical protein